MSEPTNAERIELLHNWANGRGESQEPPEVPHETLSLIMRRLEAAEAELARCREGVESWAFRTRPGETTAATKWHDEEHVWVSMLGTNLEHAQIFRDAGYDVFRVRITPIDPA